MSALSARLAHTDLQRWAHLEVCFTTLTCCRKIFAGEALQQFYFAPPPEMAGEKFGLDRFWSVTSCFSAEGSREEKMRWEERRQHLLWIWEQTRERMGVMERRCEGGQEESGRGGGIWSEKSFLKKWLNQTWMNGWWTVQPRGFRVQETVNNISRALRISSKIKEIRSS